MTWRREKEEAVAKSVDGRFTWNSLAIDASFAIVWLGVSKSLTAFFLKPWSASLLVHMNLGDRWRRIYPCPRESTAMFLCSSHQSLLLFSCLDDVLALHSTYLAFEINH